MPGAVAERTDRLQKRKRTNTTTKPIKRARSESSEEDAHAQILLLEREIFESKKNYNNIATLIKILKEHSQDDEKAVIAAISLCRIFSRFLVAGDLEGKKGSTEKDVVVLKWLKGRFREYKDGLLEILEEESMSSTAITICMKLLKMEGQHLRNGQEYSFPSSFLADTVHSLLRSGGSGTARKEFSEKYMEEYDDIRFYALEAISCLLKNSHTQIFAKGFLGNALEILTAVESVPDTKDELEDFYIPAPKKATHALYSLTQHKKRAQEAWLALMNIEMDKEQRKLVLGLVTTKIAPWFMKPELLMDFLTDSYNAGGSTSLLALSGVFYLIQERNLDYPSFYKKLYSLLDSELLHSKHRSRFFRLLDTFLGSTHLPAVLVASFIKRLSRLTLHASPSGIVPVVPWIYNLLRKHPTCTLMIHREIRESEAKFLVEEEGLSDPFVTDEEDPMVTQAIESSLWEIVMLQSHYHPNVATLAKIISEQFTKLAYNLEDFLDHSYGSMLDAELSKGIKKIPVVEFEIPKKIFMKYDVESGVQDSLLVRSWALD